MNYRKLLVTKLFVLAAFFMVEAQVIVDVNLNMKHSVDGESRFGRERRMTIHANHTESDWNGHEDMLDYLINDLDVYFGRETGNATWKMQGVEQDPNKPGWANESQMITHGQGLKEWYSSSTFDSRRQYEAKSNMIMGINDFSPMYSNLSYFPTFGKGKDGWFVKDTDAAADWVGKYFEHYFAHEKGALGDPLPKYWECYNEPDMNFLNPSFGMIVSSLEKNWEYHKRVAQEIRSRLGDKAPLIGGMTWGQLDLYKSDGIPSRVSGNYWDAYSSAEAIGWYSVMLKGVGETGGVENPGVGNSVWPRAWDNKGDAWWQWDYMYQGFMDYCGADMDFYGVHMYDWPQADPNNDKASTRAGGHIEAFLDMFEWYDHQLYGKKKDIVVSEFGAVSRTYIESLANGERDWPFIKSFNQMQMQFLERPSHVVYSMPFAPTKAVWGAYEYGGKVVRYEGATLMEPRGTWTTLATEPSGGWGWGKTIHFFELWKDVEGTRIDTKSDDIDVQVDSYVNGKKAYLILNNTVDQNKTISIYTHGAGSNTLSSVEFRHLFKGDDNIPAYTVANMTTAPAQVTLKPNSTIVLVYNYASDISINQESVETKYMCDPLAGTSKNERGTQLCHTPAKTSITATVKGVSKPATGEAIIRIGGFHYSPLDGTTGMKVTKLKVNSTDVIVSANNYVQPTRGYGLGSWAGAWFGVLEIECPVSALVDGTNTIEFARAGNTEFTTIMIQTFDMTATPGRTTGGAAITGVSLGTNQSVMQGKSLALAASFTPANASNKGLTWSSSNTSVATVDADGVVTAVASSGTTNITATSTANGSVNSTITITAIPYTTGVTSISINGGAASVTVNQFENTALTVSFTPLVNMAPVIEWSSDNTNNVEIVNGKVIGKVINSSAVITAKVAGTSITDQITVNVTIPDDESVYMSEIPNELNPASAYTFKIPALVAGARSVTVELYKGADLLGTATDNVDKFGVDTATVIITLASTPDYGTDYVVKAILKEGANVIDTETKSIEVKAATPVSEVTLDKKSISILKDGTKTLTPTVYPMNAGNKAVTWSSDAEGVATVNANGVVTGVSAGTANITVTTVDGGHTKICAVTVVEIAAGAAQIIVEAENFSSEGGTVDDSQWKGEGIGVRINSQADNGASTPIIDYFNNGDYVIINFNVTTAGTYFAKAYVANPEGTKTVQITIDGTKSVSANIPATSWTQYVELVIPGNFNLTAGAHTLKIEGLTDDPWQFNVDKVILIEGQGLTSDQPGDGPILEAGEEVVQEVILYPNPATETINVTVEPQSKYIVFSTVGQLMLAGETSDNNSIDVSSLPSGLYVLHIQNGNTVVAKQFIKE